MLLKFTCLKKFRLKVFLCFIKQKEFTKLLFTLAFILLTGCTSHSYYESSYYNTASYPVNELFSDDVFIPATSGFGYRNHPNSNRTHFHNGIDLGTPHRTLLVAPDNIEVLDVYHHRSGGLTVRFRDSQNRIWGLCHLSDVYVRAGMILSKTEPLALTGGHRSDPNRGNARAPHLHLTLTVAGEYTDPEQYYLSPYDS